jgi:DNA polymerase
MFVGEAPGKREDETGRPFVGPAGHILDRALADADIPRKDVFITNVVKCRPPENRNPKDDEIYACLPYLQEQIRTISPRIIAALGTFAVRTVLPSYGFVPAPLCAVHGSVYESPLHRLVVVPLYHPAACIYTPGLLAVFREDLAAVKCLLDCRARRDPSGSYQGTLP